jgi:hypothetical protein
VTILDKHAYGQLTQQLGTPFVPINDSKPFNYLGSESSRAAYVHIPHVAPTMRAFLAGLEPDAYELRKPLICRILYGEGLPKVIEVS